jgi:predicted DNA-binding antitoxin AbrB/MazE fold protein
MSKFLKKLDFKEGDFVYIINNNLVQKNKTYKVLKLDYEEGGSFHDGYEVQLSAILEDTETQELDKYTVAFFNVMCQIQEFYFVNINNS